jgi:hypothetical protein
MAKHEKKEMKHKKEHHHKEEKHHEKMAVKTHHGVHGEKKPHANKK